MTAATSAASRQGPPADRERADRRHLRNLLAGAGRGPLAWGALALVLVLVGGAVRVRLDIAERREQFMTEARTAHRMVGQQLAQDEAIAALLALLSQPAGSWPEDSLRRLPAMLPQLVAVEPVAAASASAAVFATHPWGHPRVLAGGTTAPAVLGGLDAARGHYALLLPGAQASWVLTFDARRVTRQASWPFDPADRVRSHLQQDHRQIVFSEGPPADLEPIGLTPGFVFAKSFEPLAPSLWFHARQATGPSQWPWPWLVTWALLCPTAVAVVALSWRQRRLRLRSQSMLRLAHASRLNEMGELTAGIAHELNQPLTAVLAGARTAQRLLREPDEDDPLALPRALDLTAGQAQRARDVLARLRRLVEPATGGQGALVALAPLVQSLAELLAPELERRQIHLLQQGQCGPVRVDPGAVEQILHNLLVNAMQALQHWDGTRQIVVELQSTLRSARVQVRDSGPGLPPSVLEHLFLPFQSTRPDGLGLGLPLCDTLARAQGGKLEGGNAAAGGAVFTLELPLADIDTPS